jgi:dihydrofolate reductase
MLIKVIVTYSRSTRGIGYQGMLPWKLHDDMKYFKYITTHCPKGKTNAVIMGRKTWESIPESIDVSHRSGASIDVSHRSGASIDVSHRSGASIDVSHRSGASRRPLSDRYNIVVSSTGNNILGCERIASSVDKAILMASLDNNVNDIYIIGGGMIYSEVMNKNLCDEILVTEVCGEYTCDVFFPHIDLSIYDLTKKSNMIVELVKTGVRSSCFYSCFRLKYVKKCYTETDLEAISRFQLKYVGT